MFWSNYKFMNDIFPNEKITNDTFINDIIPNIIFQITSETDKNVYTTFVLLTYFIKAFS